jgi:hypothetical protein
LINNCGEVGRSASEEVILQLVSSKCRPMPVVSTKVIIIFIVTKGTSPLTCTFTMIHNDKINKNITVIA